MKAAFIHDMFVQAGGGERAGEELARCLPDQDVFSSVVVHERLTSYMRGRSIKTSWMQRLPAIKRLYRHYFLFYPFAFRSFDLSTYDCVITSCYGMAKMVRKRPGAIHICYCHTPPRWIWQIESYLEKEQMSSFSRRLLRSVVNLIKNSDLEAAADVDYL